MTNASSQLSAVSFQLSHAHRCRIVCDENEDHFRLALCRTFCAGACPEHDRNCVSDDSAGLPLIASGTSQLKADS